MTFQASSKILKPKLLRGSRDRVEFMGSVGRPHGIKGDFFLTGRHTLLGKVPAQALLELDDNVLEVDVAGYKVVKERDVLSLGQFQDRTSVEKAHGAKLWAEVDTSSESQLDALVNSPVSDSLGAKIGLVKAFFNYGASDTIEIQGEDGRLLELPLVEAYFGPNFGARKTLQLIVPAGVFSDLWQEDTSDEDK